ncbi:MAG: hypothetical protein ABIZ91_13735, partial [Gemmatimonadaceae bacterium]
EEASGTQLPSRLALGFGTAPRLVSRYVDVAANAGLVVRRDGEVLPSGGAELIATPIEGIVFAARVGARRPELQAQRPFTTGAGFTFDRLTIDYAWDDMRGSGGAHRISLRVR